MFEENLTKEEENLFHDRAAGSFAKEQDFSDHLKKLVRKLRQKYQASQLEHKDLRKEHNEQLSDLRTNIIQMEKDLLFYQQSVEIILSENELYKLKERAEWDDMRGQWYIPLFFLHPKTQQINFPTINQKQRVA